MLLGPVPLRADPELDGALALVEDLQFAAARAALRALLERRPRDPGVHRAWILLAAYDPGLELLPELRRYRRLSRADPARPELRFAWLFGRSLARGYHAPWVEQPRLERPAQRPDGELWEAVRRLAESSNDPWILGLAAQLAPLQPLQSRYLAQALRRAPAQLELLSLARSTNLHAGRLIHRRQLEQLGRAGGPRAGACLLAVAAELEPDDPARNELLRAALEQDDRYRDDARYRLLQAAPPDVQRLGELRRLVDGPRCSAWGAAARLLFERLLAGGDWRGALDTARRYQAQERVFGPRSILFADRFYERGRFALALEWYERGIAGAAGRVGAQTLARCGRAARRAGQPQKAAEYLELAAHRGEPYAPIWRTEAVLARAVSYPYIVIGNAAVLLCVLLAGPLALVVLHSRLARARGAWPVAAIAASIGLALQLAGPGRPGLQWSALELGGTFLVALAGLHVSRLAGLVPGRELRALRKRLAGRAVPLAGFAGRWLLVVALMLGITFGLAALLQPRPAPILAEASRLLPDSPLGVLLRAREHPWQASLIGLRAAFREELLCRLLYLALLVRLLRGRRWGRPAAVCLVSLVWAVGHAGMVVPESYKLIQVFLLGLLLGWLTLRQGVVSAFLAHGAVNLCAVWLDVSGWGGR